MVPVAEVGHKYWGEKSLKAGHCYFRNLKELKRLDRVKHAVSFVGNQIEDVVEESRLACSHSQMFVDAYSGLGAAHDQERSNVFFGRERE